MASSSRQPDRRKFPGNMPDQTTINDFVSENKIANGIMILDNGFYNESLFGKVDRIDGLSYLIPLKQNSAFIRNYGIDNPTDFLQGYRDGTILSRKSE